MNVLILCEHSSVPRSAFGAISTPENPIYTLSVDLLPSDIRLYDDKARGHFTDHLIADVPEFLDSSDFDPQHWDLLIAFPPCTHLAVSGARWFKDKVVEQAEALQFVEKIWSCGVHRICLENPVSILSSYLGKPNQIIHPYMFGHTEIKRTCLWIKNLPRLRTTNVITKGRTKDLSVSNKAFPGVAEAMATQWNLESFKNFDRIMTNRQNRIKK